MGEQKCGERKGTAKDPKHTASSVKHGGGGAVACMLSLEQARSTLLMT